MMACKGRVWPWAALVLLLLAAMATTAEAAGHRALLQGNRGDRCGRKLPTHLAVTSGPRAFREHE